MNGKHEKNGKEAYPKGRNKNTAENDLADSNEQEMEKMGFSQDKEADKEADSEQAFIDLVIEQKDTQKIAEVNTSAKEKNTPSLPYEANEREALREPVREAQWQKQETKELQEEYSAFAWSQSEAYEREERKKQKKQKKKTGGAVLLGVVLAVTLTTAMVIMGLTLALGVKYKGSPSEPQQDTSSENALAESGNGTGAEKIIFVKQYDDTSGILTTSELYEKCVDSVVSILTANGSASGVGSGFVLSSDGYIATANHVVAGMSELTVVLSNGERYRAELVAGDALTDLALLKIQAENLPYVTFGSSNQLLIGEKVVAIGTPASLDYAGSVCSGEVSYLDRCVRVYDEATGALQKKMTLIQTNALVNPGNSGCPLFDEYGRVIGVITMKLGNNYSGIGFAIPSDGAVKILNAMRQGEALSDELLSCVSVRAPKLGIVGEADEIGGVYGVRVVRFSSDSASAAAILKTGDLIIRIDNKMIQSAEDVSAAINQKAPGDTITLTVVRSGQQLTFEVVLSS